MDLKKDVIEFCNKLAQKLEYKNLEFLNGNIKDYDKSKEVDLVFSLHACNNATDYSLEKALSLDAKAIKSNSSNLKEKLVEYNKLKKFLGIKPLLEDLIKKFFLIDTNTEIPYN